MKQKKRPASQTEAMKLRWKKRIVFEKGYTEMCAEWMAERLEALTDHLQYGHAAIAYQKQNGDFRLVKATLIYTPGSVDRPPAIRTRSHSLSKTERRLQVGESDTDLL
ncbi:uncharacterized protein BN669_01596 [Bacteroides fragilis CAG:47]|nr:uncharacterized protein BN669_01596 [Bacteroides fragilis CAG:47]